MEKIHYVWLGSPPAEINKAIATPNEVARKIGVSKVVHFWCQEAHKLAFTSQLEANVVVRSLESLKTERFRMELQLKNRALNLIDSLLELKAPIMAKDLLNLVLLHTFGGYTIDTTTQMASSIDLARFSSKTDGKWMTFERAVKKSHSSFVVVRTNYEKSHPEIVDPKARVTAAVEGFFQHQPKLITTRTLEVGYDDYCGVPVLDVPTIDIWAMYSPAGFHAVWSAVESYVIRCESLGLDLNRTPAIREVTKQVRNAEGGWTQSTSEEISDGISMLKRTRVAPINEEEEGKQRGYITKRNNVIGVTAVHSVLDGLVAAYGTRLNDLEKHLCKTVAYEVRALGGTGNRDIVPVLGLIKTYNGTWRAG